MVLNLVEPLYFSENTATLELRCERKNKTNAGLQHLDDYWTFFKLAWQTNIAKIFYS